MSTVQFDPAAVAAVLEARAREFAFDFGPEEIGRVLEAGDAIAIVSGLPGVMAEEMLEFPNEVMGLALNLERDRVGAILFGDYTSIGQGDTVKRTCRVLEVPAGEALLGRVVSPLGRPLDGRGPITAAQRRIVEVDAPTIVDREPISEPLQTGLKSVDSMTAIGRGQRELIIGDRQTGKTTLAMDAILNQVESGVTCFYVAIGQKMSTISRIAETLESRGALSHCTIVAATAADPAPVQFIAPFAACAMAEAVRDGGGHALIVYDDLSKHAVAYREVSLLLRRPPGREAYPGDIFYLHSRLLERACKLHARLGGGSLTALPIVETQQGDYSAYIPTNLVSITDGQIYLESSLFHQGFRPAVNVGLSVSRVGGKAQRRAMKRIALPLRLDLAQYREVAAFAQLTADLDEPTMRQLHRGERLAEMLKQPAGAPMPLEQQVFAIWAAVNGHLDDLPLYDLPRFEKEWLALLNHAFSEAGRKVRETGDLTPDIEETLRTAMGRLKAIFVPAGEPDTLSAERVVPAVEDQAARFSETIVGTAR